MRRLARSRDASERQLDQLESVTAIHSACATLARTPPTVIQSLTVSVPFVEFPIPARSTVDLADRIASEYGLIAEAVLKERFLVVRLCRRPTRADTWRHASR